MVATETIVPTRIQYWSYEQIDQGVVDLIVEHGLFDPHFAAMGSGLASAPDYYRENDASLFSHLWLAEHNGCWVGVCAIKHTGDPTVNVFVRPDYRRKGLGSMLVELALATGEEFGSIYTETGKHLYRKYGLPDYDSDPP